MIRKSKAGGCKACGKKGHYAKTCPEAQPPKPDKFKPEKVSASGRRESRCGQCGKTGHTRRNCEETKEQPAESSEAMSERQFASVCTARDHQMKSLEISQEMGIPLAEVNAAFASATYEGYLERRDII